MDKDTASQLEKMLSTLTANLDRMAYFVRQDDVSEEEAKTLLPPIGKAMGELWVMSQDIYRQYPELTPPALIPSQD